QRAAGFAREQDRPLDRFEFGDQRARAKVVAYAGPAKGDRAAREQAGQLVVLGVDGDDAAEPGRASHALVQRQIVGAGKIVDATGRHKRLESDRAAVGQLVEAIEV